MSEAPENVWAWVAPVYDHSPEYGHCLWAPDDNPSRPSDATSYTRTDLYDEAVRQRDQALEALNVIRAQGHCTGWSLAAIAKRALEGITSTPPLAGGDDDA